MKKSAYLNISRFVALMLMAPVCLADGDLLPEGLTVHGFLTQGFFHSSDNNMFGKSDDSISTGLTEIGLNANYEPFSRLRFAAQGIYRRAGAGAPGKVRLDYALADLTLWNYDNGQIGIRMGRIKTPYGLYNETRGVPFTRPTILLPGGVYIDKSRSLMLSSDGGGFYADHRTSYGDFHFKFNYGLTLEDNDELKKISFGAIEPPGTYESRPAFATQLSYEINNGEYIFAISHLNLVLDYRPQVFERLLPGKTHMQPVVFSAQYNGEKLSLTAEYDLKPISMSGYGAKLPNTVPQSWYLQASYQLTPQFQATVRYSDTEIRVKRGNTPPPRGVSLLPASNFYANDLMVGLRWDINSAWMVRAEYHRINGKAGLSDADNPDKNDAPANWDLYGLQISLKF